MQTEGVRYIPEAVRKGEAFLGAGEKKTKINQWKRRTQHHEVKVDSEDLSDKKFEFRYPAARIEGSGEYSDKKLDISYLHEEKFIVDIIPKLIRNNGGRKIKILDIGGGAALFAKQIRDTFGDQVEVFTTGLKKEAAKTERKLKGVDSKLHKNDLKWRSVLELHDFPEFDLITDTYGEATYGFVSDSYDKAQKYFEALVKKLMAGGHASIVFITPAGWSEQRSQQLAQYLRGVYGVEVDMKIKSDCLKTDQMWTILMKIDKPKKQIEQK